MIFYFKLPIPWLNQKTSLKGICIYVLSSIAFCQQIRQRRIQTLNVHLQTFPAPPITFTHALSPAPLWSKVLIKSLDNLAVTSFLSHWIHSPVKVYTYCATLNACNQFLITETVVTRR